MTLRELMKAADACGLMWFRMIDGDTGACCYISSHTGLSHSKLIDREVAEIAIEEGVYPDLKRGAKAVLAVKTAKTVKAPEPAERPKNGCMPQLSLRTDDVHYGDRLHRFRVRMAREQSFTANIEAHDAAEAEIVAENFCEAMGSERWDALSEHVHKTFEAEPAGGGRRTP